MATVTLKQEISKLLKDVLLKVCQKITPFTEQLELHGLLLLETDGVEFCTVTFKDAKVLKASDGESPNTTDSGEGGQQNSLTTCLPSAKTGVKDHHEEEGDGMKRSLINNVVQEAIGIWEDLRCREETVSDQDQSKRTERIPLSSSIEEIIRTYENRKRSWNQMNWRREKNKNGKYECTFCYREFSYATNLTRHQRTHHGRPPIRKPRLGATSAKVWRRNKGSESSDSEAGGANASSEERSNNEESAEGVGGKQDSGGSSNEDNTGANHQNDPADGNTPSGCSGIDDPNSSRNASSFLTPNPDYPSQNSINMDLSTSYLQTPFLTDDVYFSLPDTVSTADSGARNSSLQAANISMSDARDLLRGSDNSATILSESCAPLIVNSENVATSTMQVPVNASSDASDTRMTAAATDVGAVFTTKTGKEYINIANTEGRCLNHCCPLCQRKFDFYQNLGRHVRVTHGTSIFQLEMERRQSSVSMAGGSQDADGKKKFKCDLCGHLFSFRSNLCRHKSKHHTEKGVQEKNKDRSETNSETSTSNKTDKDLPKPSPAKHKCDICGALFTFTSSLSRHMRKKHSLVRAGMYKAVQQTAAKHPTATHQKGVLASGQNQCKSSTLNHTLTNTTRTNQAKFAIPLTNYLPYDPKDQLHDVVGDCEQDQHLSALPSSEQNNNSRSEPLLSNTNNNNNNNNNNDDDIKKRSQGNAHSTKKNVSNTESKASACVKADDKSQSHIPSGASRGDKRLDVSASKSARKLPSERYRHKCNICNQLFTFRTNLTRHTRKIHRTCPDFSPELLSSPT